MSSSTRKELRKTRKGRTLLANEARAYRDYVKWSNSYREANAKAPVGDRVLLRGRLTRKEFYDNYEDIALGLTEHGGRYSNRLFAQRYNVRVNNTQLNALADFFTTNTDFGEKVIGRKPNGGEARHRTMFDTTWLGKTREEFLEDFMPMSLAEQRRLLTMYYAYEGNDIGYGNQKVFDI